MNENDMDTVVLLHLTGRDERIHILDTIIDGTKRRSKRMGLNEEGVRCLYNASYLLFALPCDPRSEEYAVVRLVDWISRHSETVSEIETSRVDFEVISTFNPDTDGSRALWITPDLCKRLSELGASIVHQCALLKSTLGRATT